jgi:hypothetical protein
MTDMRVIVTGSREWPSRAAVWEALAWVLNENVQDGETMTVVHGAARGADRFAAEWCHLPEEPGYHVTVVEEPHPADWGHCRPECSHPPKFRRDGTPYCPAAGNYRNAEMVALGADLVIAFPLPGPRERSRGTWDCIDRAEAAGITVEVKELEFQPRFTFDDVAEAVAEVRGE